MTTEQPVGAPGSISAHPDTGKKELIITVVVLFFLATAITLYWAYGMKHGAREAQPFVLYENDMYRWYGLTGSAVAAIDAPVGLEPGRAVYPDGHGLAITKEGLVWQSAATSTMTLIERTSLTPESSFVSADGTLAVLYNQVTNAYDVFSVTYEGAYVSYVASFAPPALPAYPIAGAAIGPSTIVLHTGNPDSFLLYEVGEKAVTPKGAASLSTPAPAAK